VITTPHDSPLNENQQRRLRVTCEHIDRILSEIENVLGEAGSEAAFPSYIPDITAAQQRAVEDYIANVRVQLARTLDRQGISKNPPAIPISRAIRSRLYSIDIAAEEIKPRHMRGFGKVSATAATELNIFAGELQEKAIELHEYLAGEKN
jgi:hypothetical protein